MTGPLDELRRLDRERTPGEWRWSDRAAALIAESPEAFETIVNLRLITPTSKADAEYIAACSRLVPVLLDRLDQLEAVKDAAEAVRREGWFQVRSEGTAFALIQALAALPSPAEETP